MTPDGSACSLITNHRNPMDTAILILQYGLKYGPALALQIAELFHKEADPTIEDWRVLFGKLKSYDDYIEEAKKNAPAPTPPPQP